MPESTKFDHQFTSLRQPSFPVRHSTQCRGLLCIIGAVSLQDHKKKQYNDLKHQSFIELTLIQEWNTTFVIRGINGIRFAQLLQVHRPTPSSILAVFHQSCDNMVTTSNINFRPNHQLLTAALVRTWRVLRFIRGNARSVVFRFFGRKTEMTETTQSCSHQSMFMFQCKECQRIHLPGKLGTLPSFWSSTCTSVMLRSGNVCDV